VLKDKVTMLHIAVATHMAFEGEIWGFQETNMNVTVLWDIVPCSLIEIYLRFGGAYSIHHQDG
jgi:hypothetical protein